MKEAFKNEKKKKKKKRISDKRQKDLKATVEVLENGIRALSGNLTEGRPSKVCFFLATKDISNKRKE